MQNKKVLQETQEGVNNCDGPSGSGKVAQRGTQVRGTNHLEKEKGHPHNSSEWRLDWKWRAWRTASG